ncbi:hypothetical protein SFR_1549 [Streptomyces sp. FR-008]|nr:hypothetical protein SFR_1549 [Streptomyces sp. FR-008]
MRWGRGKAVRAVPDGVPRTVRGGAAYGAAGRLVRCVADAPYGARDLRKRCTRRTARGARRTGRAARRCGLRW